ncbi:bacterial alpha-L-rhamnosidase-domain-containing protein [Penicillium concentricum]|uniref:Bacterial alpha-L-rhamnosidase-domain-containing protein n=1 Tax=Penicillium concentricum TaxID=293559 RepID=A0A9W9S9V1_9EURO|nr:bacterial alpha-L-rhamnosidase-domain-containing protein [Penicillium concentricum]KAJ5374237.1 bacterial alpha-L-rhamnosidase-domain-containing protein [Penicillium concentricum]
MAAETFDTSWMWHPSFREDDSSTAGRFVHFRKNFIVNEEPPKTLRIKITADTRYKLYINCQLVSFGPVKGDVNIWFYDEIDISPYIHSGDNRIAIHVLRLFSGTSYGTSFPRLGSGGVKIATIAHDTMWSPQIQSSTLWETAVDLFTKLRIDEPEDDFLHVYEKTSILGSEDVTSLDWVPAIILRYQSSTGVSAPWKLSPRLIPNMENQKVQFTTIWNVKSCRSTAAWLAAVTDQSSEHEDIHLPAGTSHQLDLEAPHHITAFIRLRFKRPLKGGATVIITYSEAYEDKPEQIPYLRRKGDRRDKSKCLIGPRDIFVLRGHDSKLDLGYHESEDTEEILMPFHWRTLRFIRLNIQVGSSDLTWQGIEVNMVRYPLEVLGAVKTSSDDGIAEKLYETSVQTLRNCMHDCYEDCPFYEQLQYAMDTRSSALFTYYTSADDRLARQAIIQLHSSFQPSIGLTASRAPSNQLQIIPHFSLYWVCMLHDHFTFFGDRDFIRPFLPVLDAVLGYFHARISEKFDLVALPSTEGIWNFHDWTEQWRPYGIPPSVVKSGISTYTNSLYAYTLKMASQLQLECGSRPALAEEYSDRASRIGNAVQRHCFDGQYFTDSLAADSDPNIDRSQQNQVWAVLSGAVCATNAQYLLRRALNTLNHSDSIIKTSISMSFYTLRAISGASGPLYDELFHEFWQPWRDQLALQLTTWEEDDVSHRSDCHAWGSAPIHEFLAEVAGIRPAKPGWEEMEFTPRIGLYRSLEAAIPFYREGRVALAKVTWARADSDTKTRVFLSITGLSRPISVHVRLPGQAMVTLDSSEEMCFIWMNCEN